MEAKQLMIGDLIYVYGRNGNMFLDPRWYIRKVTADWLADMERREANDKKLTDNGIVIPDQLFIGDTKPIPLAEDMLKANGFIQESDGYTWYDGVHSESQVYVNIALRKNGEARRVNILNLRKSFCIDGCGQLSYVHQLQQALRICELDDLANNLKI